MIVLQRVNWEAMFMNITMENARNKQNLVNKRCAMKALNQNSA